jgi:hemoglobin
MNLFEELGGAPAVSAAVDSFYKRVVSDPELSVWFAGVELGKLKDHQRAFLAVGLGGPEFYEGRSMRTAHRGQRITDEAYTAALEHLAEALTELGVQEPITVQVIARIERLRVSIVGA